MLPTFLPSYMMLEKHREVIEREFVYVGVAEDLDPWVDRLADKLELQPVAVPVENASPRTEDVPDGAREAFRERNPLAYAVYEHSVEHYLD